MTSPHKTRAHMWTEALKALGFECKVWMGPGLMVLFDGGAPPHPGTKKYHDRFSIDFQGLGEDWKMVTG